jgi:hypothetical protein
MLDFKELLDWALLPQQMVHRVEKGGSTCVWREGIIHVLLASQKMAEENYPDFLDYLVRHRGKHGLGEEYEFVPPAVPFAKKGFYFLVIEMPSVDKIYTIAKEYDFSRIGRKRSDRPEYNVPSTSAYKLILNRLYPDAYIERLSPEIKSFVREHLEPAMIAAGWQFNDGMFVKAMTPDFTTRKHMDRHLTGDPIDPRQFNQYVSQDVYDYQYYLPDQYFPQDFQDHVKAMAAKYGYVLLNGMYVPKPMEMPDNIKDIGTQILSSENLIYSKIGAGMIPISIIRDHG